MCTRTLSGAGKEFDGHLDDVWPDAQPGSSSSSSSSGSGGGDASPEQEVYLERFREVAVKEIGVAAEHFGNNAPQLRKHIGVTPAELSELHASVLERMPEHPGPSGGADAIKEYLATIARRQLPVEVFGVFALSRFLPVLVLQGRKMDDGRQLSMQALLYTGGNSVAEVTSSGWRCGTGNGDGSGGGGAPGAHSSSSNVRAPGAQQAAGARCGIDAADMLCVGACGDHFYGAVPRSGFNVLLPPPEVLAASAQDGPSACKDLGTPFHMAMVPRHLRHVLEEVAIAAYINDGRVEVVEPAVMQRGQQTRAVETPHVPVGELGATALRAGGARTS